jgi:hypothetical protein
LKKRYPLEPLRATKQREKEDAARSMGESAKRRVAAERSEAALAARGRASEAARRGVIVAEESRASGGQVRAEDMARLDAFRRRAETLAQEQSAAERAAERVTAAAIDEERRDRERLAHAHAEGRVVERHHARHRANESARAERIQDEDALDARALRNAGKKARGT